MGWSSWQELEGTTGNACTAFAPADGKLYLLASGVDDRKIYVRSRDTGWSGWTELGGTSDAPLAAVVFDGAYHFFAKGLDRRLYLRTTASIPGPKRWKSFGTGTTGNAVSAVVFDGRLHVFAIGEQDRRIYVRSRTPTSNWSDWDSFGGKTDAAVCAVVFRNVLYVFAKGLDDDQLYVRSRPVDGRWDDWRQVGGATNAPVAAAVFAGDLHLFAKGLDNHLYSLIVGRANHWSPWFPLPPVKATTDTSVAVANFGNTLHLFSKGIGDRKIYTQSMHIYRLPFEDDGEWEWGRGNWDEHEGGHGPGDQLFDFDFDHPEGGNVRAAREGEVVFVENNDGNTSVDSTVPGWGTAIHIRHDDDSTAAYMHMQYLSTRPAKGARVRRGEIIGLSGNTGDSSHAHLHFGIHSSTDGNAGTGPHVPVYFRDKNHKAWRPQKGDPLASDNS